MPSAFCNLDPRSTDFFQLDYKSRWAEFPAAELQIPLGGFLAAGLVIPLGVTKNVTDEMEYQ